MSIVLSGDNGVTFPNSTVQASAGSILQVVNATYSTQVSSASSTYADTGLTATITPKFATSKILVIVNLNGCGKTTGNTYVNAILLRGSTTIATLEGIAGNNGSTSNNFIGSISTNYQDSPATVSSTTYKVQFASGSNVASVYVSYNNVVSTITLMEIAG